MEEQRSQKKKRNILLGLTALVVVALVIGLGVSQAKEQKKEAKKESVKQTEKIDTSQFTVENIRKWLPLIEDRYTVVGNQIAKEQMSMIGGDTDIIKSIVPHLDDVDVNTTGEYEVSYDVTVYCKALKTAMDGGTHQEIKEASGGQTTMIKVPGTVTVVDKQKAIEMKESGFMIYGI